MNFIGAHAVGSTRIVKLKIWFANFKLILNPSSPWTAMYTKQGTQDGVLTPTGGPLSDLAGLVPALGNALRGWELKKFIRNTKDPGFDPRSK